jgi:pimeloyl-ACP methyl ester carboxylesterase
MKKIFIVSLFLSFIVQACTSPTPAPAVPAVVPSVVPTETPIVDTASRLAALGGYPCPNSNFTCVKLTVPLNHFDLQDKRTIQVVFGILPATGKRKGMFVTATGGPGSAGLTSADDYTASFDPSIPEHFDIVFFDQRGVGQSGGLQCAKAAADFYRANWDGTTPEGETALVKTAQTFSNNCVQEMGNPEILPYLGTEQAVEDLEALRAALKDEKFWLYGESYGTQYAQTYAAVHPDHLAGLILDGTVDLTLSGTEFYTQQARAFSNTFISTLKACNEDKLCSQAMNGQDAIAVYNQLSFQLKKPLNDCLGCSAELTPRPFKFPLPAGGIAQRNFSFSDLETGASSYMYSEGARMIFLRALAAYVRNEDLVPLARILYNSLTLDPETLAAIPDPAYSDGVFYGVECQDYGYFSGTPEERATAYLRAGNEVEAGIPHFSSIIYSDLPCVSWPNARKDSSRPKPLTAEGIPTLVLGALADPATPISNGQAVFKRLSDGYLVTQDGGPHVIYGRSVPCVDDLVTNFLVNDQMPAERKTTCAGSLIHDFVPLAPLNASQFANPLDALKSADDEIYYLPEYYFWDMTTPTSVGCPFGGTLHFEKINKGDSLTLDQCAFSEGFVMTGSGSNNYDEGTLKLGVNVTGLKNGQLSYTRDGEGALLVTGIYGGGKIDITK